MSCYDIIEVIKSSMDPLVIGLDIGGTRVKAALVDANGTVLASRQAPTPGAINAFVETIGDLVVELRREGPAAAAVGIGCKGIIDTSSSRVVTLPGTLHYLEGALLSELLAPCLPAGCQVRADNDARAALLGEMLWGAARGCNDVLMLTLGTGVGGAVLSGGHVLRGASGVGGHIGHLTVDPDGVDCICGNRGCLETVFSARAIESEAAAAILRGVATSLRRADGVSPSCAEVFACAGCEDAVARHIVDRAIRVLAAGVAGLVHVFDPERVVIGGQIAEAGEALLEPLRREVQWRTRGLLRRDVTVVGSGLADPSGVLGAAAFALRGYSE